MKAKLLMVVSLILILVGCSTETDVTETYFQPGYEYAVSGSAGRRFYFDELNDHKFSYEGYNRQAPRPKNFGLPMTVNKVGNYKEYDVISFEPHFEESRFPDYDWHQENRKPVGVGLDPTSISQRIIFEDYNFIIVPFNTDYQTYYALLPEQTDEATLDRIINHVESIDYDFVDGELRRENNDSVDGIVGEINKLPGYLLYTKPV